MKLPFKLPSFKLPKLGKREQKLIETGAPVIADAVLRELEKPHPNAPLDPNKKPRKAPKRDALWYIKLAVICGVAIAPQLVDAFPDQTWDDKFADAVGILAAVLGVRHAIAKPK